MKEETIVAIDYKGKHFMLTDENRVDEMDFIDQNINVPFIIENQGALENHVADCLYYGIPAYVGSSKALNDRVDAIYKKLETEN